MNVGVKHGLSCCFAGVHSYVYSLRFKLILDQVPHYPNQIKDIRIFLVRQFQIVATCRLGITIA